jgi:hypothetical protein
MHTFSNQVPNHNPWTFGVLLSTTYTFRLPSLTSDNFAEGVVIKPYQKVVYVETAKGKSVRAIVKHKIEEFSETTSKQQTSADSSMKWKSYFTSNRLNNVISKFGKVRGSKVERKKLIDLLISDALDAYAEKEGAPLNIKDPKLKELCELEASGIVNKYFDGK